MIPVDFRRTPDHPTLLSPGVEKRDPIPTLAETLRNEAVFLREQKIETVSVVLRPDDQTELSISLLQRDGVIEATAHLRRGDFETLNRDWEQLQRELRESRVQLSDLTSSTGDGRQSHPGHSGPYTYYPLDEPAFPSFRTGASAPPEAAESKTSMAADPAHWERWA